MYAVEYDGTEEVWDGTKPSPTVSTALLDENIIQTRVACHPPEPWSSCRVLRGAGGGGTARDLIPGRQLRTCPALLALDSQDASRGCWLSTPRVASDRHPTWVGWLAMRGVLHMVAPRGGSRCEGVGADERRCALTREGGRVLAGYASLGRE